MDTIDATLSQSHSQLLTLDTSGERVKPAIAVGDVDVAEHVAVSTQGFTSTVDDRMVGYGRDMPCAAAAAIGRVWRGRCESHEDAVGCDHRCACVDLDLTQRTLPDSAELRDATTTAIFCCWRPCGRSAPIVERRCLETRVRSLADDT